WSARVTKELTATPAPFFVELIDPNDVSLANRTAALLRDDADAGPTAIGSLTTSARGAAQLTTGPAFVAGRMQVGQDQFVSSFVLDPDASCGAALAFEQTGGLDDEPTARLE